MAVKSGKQYRFMEMVAHSKKPLSGVGLSKEQAEEFIHKTPRKLRRKFSHAK